MTRPGRARIRSVAFGVGLALIAAEVVARLVVAPFEVVVEDDAASATRRAAENTERRELRGADAPLQLYVQTAGGRRLRANTIAYIPDRSKPDHTVVLRTNSLGYRNPELEAKRDPRVLFLGDSITLGEWLDEDDTFVRRVESLSRQRARPIETVNAAVAGIGLATECAILIETGITTAPDVVVVGFYLNDALDSPAVVFRRPPPALAWSRLAQVAARTFGAQVVDRPAVTPADLAAWRAEILELHPVADGDPTRDRGAFQQLLLQPSSLRDWSNVWADGAWRAMQPYFDGLLQMSREHGFRLMFVCFPVRWQVEATPLWNDPQRRLAQLAAALGAPMLDLLPLLRDAHAKQEGKDEGAGAGLFVDQCHHTARGNELIADAIESFLAM